MSSQLADRLCRFTDTLNRSRKFDAGVDQWLAAFFCRLPGKLFGFGLNPIRSFFQYLDALMSGKGFVRILCQLISRFQSALHLVRIMQINFSNQMTIVRGVYL